jgi:hypothetical protein
MTLEMPARKQVTPLGVSQTVPNALLVLTFQYFHANLKNCLIYTSLCLLWLSHFCSFFASAVGPSA